MFYRKGNLCDLDLGLLPRTAKSLFARADAVVHNERGYLARRILRLAARHECWFDTGVDPPLSATKGAIALRQLRRCLLIILWSRGIFRRSR